jgi:beta-N-acetylhexosaminidase
MAVRDQIGQLFMIGVSSSGLSADERDVLRATRVGSVLLLGNTEAGSRAVTQVVRAADRAAVEPSGVQPLLAADQEGGQVQRLRGPGFRRIPSAEEQAELSDAELRRKATTWGRELRRSGVDADLAPVADVVPESRRSSNAPIGQLDRGYGSNPAVVSAKVTAFVRGMNRAEVATAVKHFPGLGQVRGNTDFEDRVVDRVTTRNDKSLAGFRAAVAAGVDMVMVSSAYYRRIDPDRRAGFSPTVMTLLRRDLGFSGVVISDDLTAAGWGGENVRTRALRFLRAGGDLAIVGDASQARALVDAVADVVRSDPEFATEVRAKATRVVELKRRRGLARC